MPIAEKKQAHNAKSVPLGILNKGPDFFRQQALRNQRRHGKTAAEQLAESRSQFLKWEPATPQRQLNDNSNNHSTDSRLDSNRTDLKQTRGQRVSPLVHEDKVIRQERKSNEFEKRESRRGRDKNRDNRRSRKRTKERGNDVNGNSQKNIAFEKASLDTPEHDGKLKDVRTLKIVSENGGETSGTTDEAELVVQSRRSRSQTRSKSSPRPTVKDMVSKIGSDKSNERTVDETPTILDHLGRQRQKRTLNFVSSESSETSPVLPRRGDYFSRNTRPPAVRGRERAKPSPVLKPRNNVAGPKSPAGSHVQNVLNVLHQQTSTSSSSHDETPKRNFRKSGARVRGKSCPPTSRSKPSLADLLAKDAEGGRPRSKDLSDLDNLPTPKSEDSNIVKSRIKSFQSPASQTKKSSLKTLSKKLSNGTSDELMPSIDGSSNHSLSKRKHPVECQISAPTSSNHALIKGHVNSTSPVKVEEKELPKAKSEMRPRLSELYTLPNKQTHRRHRSASVASCGSASSDTDEEPPVLHPRCISGGDFTPVLKKPLLKSKSADVGLESKGETGPSVKLSSSGKPALPKKPDVSIIKKHTRMSYHFYEEVSEPSQESAQETTVDPKDNVFENPVHYSDPDESFEVVQNVTDPTESTLSCRPDPLSSKPENVAIVVEHREEEKEDPKQSSMFSSFSSHMKRLKGMILREKDSQVSLREEDEQCDEQKVTEKASNSKSANEQSGLFGKTGKKPNYQSPTQRKLAAQLGLECKEKLGEFNLGKHEESIPLSNEGKIPKMSSRELGVKNYKEGDTESKNVKLMLPVHSKSFSWDDLNKKKRLKTSLSDNTALATSPKDDKATKGKSDELLTSSNGHFHMPHEKQKQDLSKKLALFLKQSKAYNSPGSSPTKGSCESGKLKKKVSFDATAIPEETGRTSEKEQLIRKVSITPLNQNYDEVEYNADLKKDLVEETIIIDSSNSIRLASPRLKHPPTSSDNMVTQKMMSPRIPKISEGSCRDLPVGDAASHNDDKEMTGSKEVEMLVELYDDPIPSQEKSFDKEPSMDDNKGGAVRQCPKTSKLVDFRKASVSTDLDTSPTHDYRGVSADGHSEVKHKSGTSSSGNARVKGEYDTSSRSDDCGLGATRGRVKHLKPYNARPFRNKNFSSDEDVIPEETTRKSFWQTKAQLDIPNSRLKTAQVVKQHAEGPESSADTDTSSQSSKMRRSKSEPSNATSAHELDRFFEKMGLDDSILEVAGKPHIYNEEEVFHEMHVWRTRGIRGSESDDSNTSYAMSETSNVSEEGVMNLRKFTKQLPDQSMSIVTKNARVIKWMCQCKKARNQSIS